MEIAVIGWGNIGRTLGTSWRAAGHGVHVATRDPASERSRALNDEGWSVGTLADVAPAADVLVPAIPGTALIDLVTTHRDVFASALVIDTTNALGPGPLNHVPEVAALVPAARWYRAFTTLAWENYETPQLDGRQLDQFFVGPDGPDRAAVAGLIRDIGLRPVWLGGPEDVDILDAVTRAWFHLVMGLGYPRRTALAVLSVDPRDG